MKTLILFIMALLVFATLCGCSAKSETTAETVVDTTVEDQETTVETTKPNVEETITPATEATQPPVTETAPPSTAPTEATTAKKDETTEPTYAPEYSTDSSGLVSLGTFKLTAYCTGSCCNGQWAGLTSTGATPTPGRTIAVDPSVIPYGSKVVINGHTYIAEDCGGSIKGNRIDILFGSHSDALVFGVQNAEVFIMQ